MGVNKTNRCNINSSVATLIDNRRWGISTDRNTIKSIIENYAVSLNCPTEDIDICYPDTCNNQAQVITCSINITSIAAITNLPLIQFVPNFTNPSSKIHTFLWSYDTCIFDLYSNDGKGVLTLKVKPNIDLATTIARISVTITDEYNCTATKTCYLASNIMQCNNYVACSNVCNLVVTLNTE